MTESETSTLSIRFVHAEENPVVRRLAELDDAPPLEGDVLLALVDSQPVAALALHDGRVVADPFRPTADTVKLLSLRAGQLARWRARRRVIRLPRLRAA